MERTVLNVIVIILNLEAGTSLERSLNHDADNYDDSDISYIIFFVLNFCYFAISQPRSYSNMNKFIRKSFNSFGTFIM
jgi:hypothetical protein